MKHVNERGSRLFDHGRHAGNQWETRTGMWPRLALPGGATLWSSCARRHVGGFPCSASQSRRCLWAPVHAWRYSFISHVAFRGTWVQARLRHDARAAAHLVAGDGRRFTPPRCGRTRTFWPKRRGIGRCAARAAEMRGWGGARVRATLALGLGLYAVRAAADSDDGPQLGFARGPAV